MYNVSNAGFARLGYSASWNLGDHIQSLATEQFIPPRPLNIERHQLSEYNGEFAFLIMQGYFFNLPQYCSFPPSEKIIPIFFGFHIEDSVKTRKQYSSPEYINYFKKHEPIGCRDISTMNFLKENKVDAFFSGCLTLTFPKREHCKIQEKIFFIDTPSWLKPGENTGEYFDDLYKNAIFSTQVVDENIAIIEDEKKRNMALELLNKLQNQAKLVVTSRLHIALPCIAMGIPVVCIPRLTTPVRYEAINGLIPLYHFPKNVSEENYEITREKFIREEINFKPIVPDVENKKKDMIKILIEQIHLANKRFQNIYI